MIPTARLWLAAALLALPTAVAGFVDGLGLWVLVVDGALLALAAVDFELARRARLEAWRELPPRLQVGVAGAVSLHVVNPEAAPVRVALRDEAPDGFEVDDEVLTLRLSARSRARLHYRATPARRGRFDFGDVWVRVLGPLGLMWHERRVPSTVSVNVFPDMRGASRLLLSDAALDFVNLGLRQLRRDGRGSEFARLRDYAQGDSVRDVDWKATARRGRPVARVMESERSQTVLIAVDAGRSMAARVDELTKLDHAVNAALFLAFVAVKNGDRVGLVVFADGVKAWLAPAAGRLQYRKIVDALFSAQAALTYVDYLALFKELNTRVTKRSLLCIFTDFVDEEQVGTMVEPLRRLARRHVPLCLSSKDAGLTRLLETPPPDAEAAYQHAVASELLLERETMKRKVGRDGITIVDVDSNRLGLAAVNAYLEMKARGVL